jgi:hypothetical protein
MSQVLFAGGYPTSLPGNDWPYAWWYDTTLQSSSATWRVVPTFYNYVATPDNQHSHEFEIIVSTGATPPPVLAGGDVILLDLRNNNNPNLGPDNLPDHARVVVGQGNTSQDRSDYINCGDDGTVTPTPIATPTTTSDLLIDQNCIDRWHVIWNYRYDASDLPKWFIHVK